MNKQHSYFMMYLYYKITMNEKNVYVIFGLLLVCWLVFYRCAQKKGILEGFAFRTEVQPGRGSETLGYRPILGEKGQNCNEVCNTKGLNCNLDGLKATQIDPISNDVRNLIKTEYNQELKTTEDVLENGIRVRDNFELGYKMPYEASALPGVWVHSDNVGEIVRKRTPDPPVQCNSRWDQLRRLCVCSGQGKSPPPSSPPPPPPKACIVRSANDQNCGALQQTGFTSDSQLVYSSVYRKEMKPYDEECVSDTSRLSASDQDSILNGNTLNKQEYCTGSFEYKGEGDISEDKSACKKDNYWGAKNGHTYISPDSQECYNPDPNAITDAQKGIPHYTRSYSYSPSDDLLTNGVNAQFNKDITSHKCNSNVNACPFDCYSGNSESEKHAYKNDSNKEDNAIAWAKSPIRRYILNKKHADTATNGKEPDWVKNNPWIGITMVPPGICYTIKMISTDNVSEGTKCLGGNTIDGRINQNGFANRYKLTPAEYNLLYGPEYPHYKLDQPANFERILGEAKTFFQGSSMNSDGTIKKLIYANPDVTEGNKRQLIMLTRIKEDQCKQCKTGSNWDGQASELACLCRNADYNDLSDWDKERCRCAYKWYVDKPCNSGSR